MKRIRLKWILLSAVSLYIAAVVFAWVTNGDRIRANFHRFIESLNHPVFRELAAVTISQDPEKSEKLADFDEKSTKAEWYAARKDYPNMHKALSEAVADAEGAFGSNSEYLRTILISQAQKECKFEKWKVAIEAFNRALKIDPKDTNVSHWLAYAYSKDHNFRDAINVYTKAIAIKPEAGLYHGRANDYLSLGLCKNAIDDYTTAIKLDPKEPDNYHYRAEARCSLRQYQLAIDDCTKSISLDPKNLSSYVDSAYDYNMLDQPKAAIEMCNKAISITSPNSQLYVERAYAHNSLGEYREAIDECNKAIPLDPKNGRSFYERGFAEQQLGQYQQAIDDIRASLYSYPNYFGAYRNLGFSYNKSGQPDKAIEALTKAIKLNQDAGRCYFDRADVYRSLGKTALADKDLSESKKLGYDPSKRKTTYH
jgi:tetratricopeptide (TPR) repeat protein